VSGKGSLARRIASGYSLARMRYSVLLAPDAVEDLKRLRAYDRAGVRGAIDGLRSDPKRTGRSRVKRLRGMQKPQYRLRVDDVRIFYDVRDEPEPTIEILAVVPKEEAVAWLEREGLKS
jgi:mRNA interferase RelE/StbE